MSTDKIILGLASFSFLMWWLLGQNMSKNHQTVRRFFLTIFIFTGFPPYCQFSLKAKSALLSKVDFTSILINLTGEYKGTDWTDGILSATFVLFYVGLMIYLVNKEKKGPKKPPTPPPPEEKPFKIEARIGNIQEPAKNDKK
jgi:hypothetical protein